MSDRKKDLAPLSGVLFVILVLAGFIVSGSTPEPDDSAAKVVSFYSDHDTQQLIVSLLVALGAIPLLFFAATLRQRAREALPEGSILPSVALAAGVLAAAGFTIAAGVHFALADLADEIRPAAAQALNALDGSLFIPFAIGTAALVLAGSLVAVRSDLLPTWFGCAGVGLFVISWTPFGFFAFLLSGVWIVVASVLLYRGPRSQNQVVSARPAQAAMPS
jgi:hypothetical protein